MIPAAFPTNLSGHPALPLKMLLWMVKLIEGTFMAATKGDIYLASYLRSVVAENEEDARRLRKLAPYIITQDHSEAMLADAEDCMRVAKAARKALLALSELASADLRSSPNRIRALGCFAH